MIHRTRSDLPAWLQAVIILVVFVAVGVAW